MDTFEKSWQRVAILRSGETASPELRSLLQQAYEKIKEQHPEFQKIKISLENLLYYLTTESGRTSANCVATDLFFTIADWGVGWELFQETLADIIGDINGALHDAVSSPDIARNFGGLPEQLLERVRKWEP